MSAAERILADLAQTRGWFCGSTWYASYLPTFSQRVSELNAAYAAQTHIEGAQRIVSRVCRRPEHKHHGTIHEYALREWAKPEQLKLSA